MKTATLHKVDVGAYGEAYHLIISNIEKPELPEVKIGISEVEFENLKPLFQLERVSGKFNEHEDYI